ncbi:hypothetical protein GPECTOR_36g34 [Gonium pectorale]|uniref:N-acetyltransferase domain-containing protein n=1 Tax=Gonium pectorale TaxID=33097 RepID=A0A150GBV4_GONPE|nr:hypothetical protein GPECTOR_36g34 [Gonium pectorale]|eukprot:KXZ47309.1 hypothetical protein GPECTOR_36g34 [Gonium pectorale]
MAFGRGNFPGVESEALDRLESRYANVIEEGMAVKIVDALEAKRQPEALLPPPFPSNKPFRLYVSNMSVLPAHRRRGLAKRLLGECERVARLWGHTSLWLHVKRNNAAAAALYASMGYRPVDEGGLRLLPGPLSQLLMCKELPPLRNGCPLVLTRGGVAAAAGDAGGGARPAAGSGAGDVVQGVTGAARAADGVFVWNAVVADRTEDESA